MTKVREPKTQKEWDSYFKCLNELELNTRAQNVENESNIAWTFSILKLEATCAYANWVKKKVKRGLK